MQIENDELFLKAAELCRQLDSISVFDLMEQFGIDQDRASELMSELEEKGIFD